MCRGVVQLAEQQAHNLYGVGSNPTPATIVPDTQVEFESAELVSRAVSTSVGNH